MNIELPSQTSPAACHCVFLVVPRFNMTTLITMIEALRVGNYLASTTPFSWEIVCFEGQTVAASNGMTLTTQSSPLTAAPSDYVFVLGSWGAEHRESKDVSAWLRQRARRGETVCAVELGCYLVARAGLLTNKTITTHWSWRDGFQERYDQVEVVEQLYTIDNRILSCAGGLAGLDLMLHLIAERHSQEFADEIADQILCAAQRPGTAAQRRSGTGDRDNRPAVLSQAIALIESHVEEPLSVPQVAAHLGLSQRQLERQFKRHVGCTIVQYGLLHRLQHARVLLISTQMSVREIGAASGFNSLAHFSNSFARIFGRPPSKYREAWPPDEAAPTWPGTLSSYLQGLTQTTKVKP